MGAALVLEPNFATAILGGGFVRHAGSPTQRERLVPRIAEGRMKLAAGLLEPGSRDELAAARTQAECSPDGWRLTGKKTLVLHGGNADAIFVTAATGGGLGLFLVDRAAPGLTIEAYPTHDGLRAAEVRLDAVHVADDDVFGRPGEALPIVKRVVEEGIAALCAEAVDAMTVMLALTVDYLKVRQQFGGPIGRFQALQHKAAEMYIAIEQARSAALLATRALALDDPVRRAREIHAAKAVVGREARFLGETAIQLHGGIGVSLENAVGHFFKRTTALDLPFGDADSHLAALATLSNDKVTTK